MRPRSAQARKAADPHGGRDEPGIVVRAAAEGAPAEVTGSGAFGVALWPAESDTPIVSGTRLRVLLVILGVLVAGLVAQRAGLLPSSNSSTQTLSPAEAREGRALLARATPPPSYARETTCAAATSICFASTRPLQPMSESGALQIVRSFGLPFRDIATLPCQNNPPVYRGSHLMGVLLGCMGVASLGRFVASFSVTSSNSDCRALRKTVGTHIQIDIGRVGRVDPEAVKKSSVARDMQSLNEMGASVTKEVMAKDHLRPRTHWPRACRG